MKQFSSIEKIDTGILYALELTSSISVLLLAFGLIAPERSVQAIAYLADYAGALVVFHDRLLQATSQTPS